MLVCHCHALTDRDIRRAVRTTGACSVAEVGEHCGAATGCGGCHEAVAEIVAGKTNKEAMRCLRRRLSDIVYNQMRADARRSASTLGTGPGGQPGTTLQSSVADSHPDIDTSDQSLPGPAKRQPRTPSLAAS